MGNEEKVVKSKLIFNALRMSVCRELLDNELSRWSFFCMMIFPNASLLEGLPQGQVILGDGLGGGWIFPLECSLENLMTTLKLPNFMMFLSYPPEIAKII